MKYSNTENIQNLDIFAAELWKCSLNYVSVSLFPQVFVELDQSVSKILFKIMPKCPEQLFYAFISHHYRVAVNHVLDSSHIEVMLPTKRPSLHFCIFTTISFSHLRIFMFSGPLIQFYFVL